MSRELLAFQAAHAGALTRMYAESGAGAWDVNQDTFVRAVYASVAQRFPSGALARDVEAYLRTVQVRDLALACACRDGHERAWDQFVREFRPVLYGAARSLGGDRAREAADSLYAELFGLTERDGARHSLFAYYHGRSRLTTWLRSVLAQRCIDQHRAAARFDSIDDEATHPGSLRATSAPPQAGRSTQVAWVQAALDLAIESLDARDRLRLRAYYGEGLTLAQIGRVTGEHEATVSRKLDRTRKTLRQSVETALRTRHGLADAAVRECFEMAAEAPELQLNRLLAGTDDV